MPCHLCRFQNTQASFPYDIQILCCQLIYCCVRIFPECYIQIPVHTFYTPVSSNCTADLLDIWLQTTDKIPIFYRSFSILLQCFLFHHNTIQTFPIFLLTYPFNVFRLIILSNFNLTVCFFSCLFVISAFSNFFLKLFVWKVFLYIFKVMLSRLVDTFLHCLFLSISDWMT